jgi:hypothetical protein
VGVGVCGEREKLKTEMLKAEMLTTEDTKYTEKEKKEAGNLGDREREFYRRRGRYRYRYRSNKLEIDPDSDTDPDPDDPIASYRNAGDWGQGKRTVGGGQRSGLTRSRERPRKYALLPRPSQAP